MDETQNNMNVPPQKPQATQNSGGSAGSLIAVIVILALIIIGALYFWGQSNSADDGAERVMTDETVQTINAQSSSDAAAAIEADLDATDVDSLDAELNAS